MWENCELFNSFFFLYPQRDALVKIKNTSTVPKLALHKRVKVLEKYIIVQ